MVCVFILLLIFFFGGVGQTSAIFKALIMAEKSLIFKWKEIQWKKAAEALKWYVIYWWQENYYICLDNRWKAKMAEIWRHKPSNQAEGT